jgi:hypothetical protein
MLASYGAPALPIDQVAMMVGEGARKLVERALEASGLDAAEPDALARFRQIYDRRLLIHTKPYDGVPDMLDAGWGRMKNLTQMKELRLLDRSVRAVAPCDPGAPTMRAKRTRQACRPDGGVAVIPRPRGWSVIR